jgi:hypothetical protein
MGLESLTELEILLGSFTLTLTLISFIVGLKILLKYFSYKQKEYITVGLTWIFLSSAWWGSSFSFLFIILFNTPLDAFTFLLLGNAFIPVAICCWMYSFCKLAYPNLKKKLLPIYFTICILYEIFLIIFLLIDPKIIGTLEGNFYSQPNLYAMIFQVFGVLTTIITGVLFSRNSMRSDDPRIRLKGKFLLIAFISFTIGALFDAAIPLTPITLVIVRLILISSAFEYYLGFLLPDRIANWLTQNK